MVPCHYTWDLVSNYPNEDEHFDEWQEEIYDSCSLLIELGFDQDVFTIENINNHGYTDDEFLELIKPLGSITNLDELSYLANSARLCDVHLPPYDFRSLLDFIKWLKTIDGSRSLAVISNKKENLEKKKLTKSEVALAGKFVDYAASRRQDRTGIYSEIEKLRSRLMKLEMEYKSIDDELKIELGPLYEYEEPELHELRIEAYKLYEEDCKSKEILPIPKHNAMGFEKAMKEFGGIVKKSRGLVNYLNDPVRQEEVRNFFKGKIMKMEHANDDGETTIVYKFASDLCEEEISNVNMVYKFASDVGEENSNGRKGNIVYKFGSDVCKEISNVNMGYKLGEENSNGRKGKNSNGRKGNIVGEKNSNGRKGNIVCKGTWDNVPSLPDLKRARKEKAKRLKHQRGDAIKKMISWDLV